METPLTTGMQPHAVLGERRALKVSGLLIEASAAYVLIPEPYDVWRLWVQPESLRPIRVYIAEQSQLGDWLDDQGANDE